jgi:hypothetical protein
MDLDRLHDAIEDQSRVDGSNKKNDDPGSRICAV